jgi:probable rRNA maturation factor
MSPMNDSNPEPSVVEAHEASDSVGGDPDTRTGDGMRAEDQHAYNPNELELFVANEQTDVPVDLDRWSTLARAVLLDEGVVGEVEMSLMFVDEVTIAALNEQYMGKTGPTDVLSFPIDEEASPRYGGRIAPTAVSASMSAGPTEGYGDDDDDEDEQPLMLGDVLICPLVAQRNAAEHASEKHNGSLDDELALLVVHGILHLLGMDHLVDAEAEEMEAREQELLGRFYRAGTASGPEAKLGEVTQ